MATEIVMPKLGMTMVEGTVAEWLVPDGATVEAGTAVFRLTTEKIDFEVEADVPGIVRHVAPVDAVVPVGGIVGYILAPGEPLPVGLAQLSDTAAPPARAASSAAVEPAAGAAAPDGFVRATPAARRLARELNVHLAQVPGSGPGGRVHEEDVRRYAARAAEAPAAAAAPAPAPARPPAEVAATPLARRLAAEHGIDLTTVRGSGPGGRIQQEDVEREIAARRAREATPVEAAAPAPAETVPYRGMRKAIGERMLASLQSMAQLTLMAEFDVTELVRLRGQLVEAWREAGIRVSYTDFIVKAVAKALREHPRVNTSLSGERIVIHPQIDIGIAVALDDGLIVPVIRAADRKTLKEVAQEAADLAERARAGKLGVDDVTGGTFSITSLGMYGIDGFTPIINSPQAAILGVGRIRPAVALEGERPVERQRMTLSLTIDHRVLDGAPAAIFLSRVGQLLEQPYLLAFE
jgi:pyruvate dehydrogenase E2 component (dihydrolipoamide acetyltransferase)